MQSPHNVERRRDALAFEEDAPTEDSDDLDSASPRVANPSTAKAGGRFIPKDIGEPSNVKRKPVIESSGTFKRYAKPAVAERGDDPTAFQRTLPSKASSNSTTKRSPRRESTEQMTPPRPTSDYLVKKRAEKERKEREERRKAKKADEIPTFIF